VPIDVTPSHANDGLFQVLAARARATSDGALVLAVIAGLSSAIVAAAWRPPGWVLLGSIGVCAAGFGGWGIADRELAERADSGRRFAVVVLRGVRVLAVVASVLAAIVAALRMLGAALGTWIS